MKASLLLVLSLFAASLARADGSCGTPAGVYRDSDSTGYVTRVINRYRSGDAYIYTYELDLVAFLTPGAPVFDGATSKMRVQLDGQSAFTTGRMGCTVAEADALFDGRCAGTPAPYGASPDLFEYAANGDHLNVWEGDISVWDPKHNAWENSTQYRFPEKRFSEMKFEE